MILLIICLTILFTFIGFIGTVPTTAASNPILAFTILQLRVFLENPVIFFLFTGGVVSVIFALDKTPFRQKKYSPLIAQSFFAICIGFCTSFFILLCIAWVQLTSISFLLDRRPDLLGISTNPKTIAASLQNQPTSPNLLASSTDSYQQLISIGRATVGTSNFYGNTIMPLIPRFFLRLPQRKLSNIILLDNTLIVSKLDTKTLQQMSGVLGYDIVHVYFPLRQIKTSPHITVMTKQQFIAWEKQDSLQKRKQLDTDIQLLQTQVSSLSATMHADTASIAAQQSLIQTTYEAKDKSLSTCQAEGTYIAGKFVPAHTISYCREQIVVYDQTVTNINNTIDLTTKHIQDTQMQKDLVTNYLNLFLQEQKAFTITQSLIPDELGIFNPPYTVQLVVSDTHPSAVVDYLETLTHEYMHFASFVPGKHFASNFFEEGLTEYFARQAIEDALHTKTNLGYPANVIIITQMMKTIPESIFADLYFTKDEVGLETRLNQAFGDNFYQKNYPLFQALQYTITPQAKLQIVNTIMKNIGGEQLTEKDMESSFSHL